MSNQGAPSANKPAAPPPAILPSQLHGDSVSRHINELYPPSRKFYVYFHNPCGYWVHVNTRAPLLNCSRCQKSDIAFDAWFTSMPEAERHAAYLLSRHHVEQGQLSIAMAHRNQKAGPIDYSTMPEMLKDLRLPDGVFYEKWIRWTNCFPTFDTFGTHLLSRWQKDYRVGPDHFENAEDFQTPDTPSSNQ